MEKMPKWMLKNLARHKNCYIRDLKEYDLKQINVLFKCEYTTRPIADAQGYIIELQGEVDKDAIQRFIQ